MKKYLVLLCLFVLLCILLGTLGYIYLKWQNEGKKRILASFDIQLCGKVIEKREITRGSRLSTLVCLDVFYSNIDSIKVLNKKYFKFLRIEKGIASLVISPIHSEVDSIAINMNNDRMQKYYSNGKLLKEYPLSISSDYLTEEDLEYCFENK